MFRLILGQLKIIWIAVIVSIGLILGTLAPVFAQELPDSLGGKETWIEDLSPNRLSLDASTIPSEKVSQFVEAYLQVLNLIEQRESQLQAAETEVEYRRLEREIQSEAFAIIEEAGLTQQEYLQLLNLANIDPEFGERIAAQLQEASQ